MKLLHSLIVTTLAVSGAVFATSSSSSTSDGTSSEDMETFHTSDSPSAEHPKTDRPSLNVTLDQVSYSNTIVHISILNQGGRACSLLQNGTILDPDPTKKFAIYYDDGDRVPFIGKKKLPTDIPDEQRQFTPLKPDETIDFHVDAARIYDMSHEGTYLVQSIGLLPYSDPGSGKIDGMAPYRSNGLEMKVLHSSNNPTNLGST